MTWVGDTGLTGDSKTFCRKGGLLISCLHALHLAGNKFMWPIRGSLSLSLSLPPISGMASSCIPEGFQCPSGGWRCPRIVIYLWVTCLFPALRFTERKWLFQKLVSVALESTKIPALPKSCPLQMPTPPGAGNLTWQELPNIPQIRSKIGGELKDSERHPKNPARP